MQINVENRLFVVNIGEKAIEVHEGDWLSIDGGTGEVFLGELDTGIPTSRAKAR
ncbi:MAG: hypothetical protein R3A10_19925 [Caldilineaceae bacterium]